MVSNMAESVDVPLPCPILPTSYVIHTARSTHLNTVMSYDTSVKVHCDLSIRLRKNKPKNTQQITKELPTVAS